MSREFRVRSRAYLLPRLCVCVVRSSSSSSSDRRPARSSLTDSWPRAESRDAIPPGPGAPCSFPDRAEEIFSLAGRAWFVYSSSIPRRSSTRLLLICLFLARCRRHPVSFVRSFARCSLPSLSVRVRSRAYVLFVSFRGKTGCCCCSTGLGRRLDGRPPIRRRRPGAKRCL